jgi:hypothetical protein
MICHDSKLRSYIRPASPVVRRHANVIAILGQRRDSQVPPKIKIFAQKLTSRKYGYARVSTDGQSGSTAGASKEPFLKALGPALCHARMATAGTLLRSRLGQSITAENAPLWTGSQLRRCGQLRSPFPAPAAAPAGPPAPYGLARNAPPARQRLPRSPDLSRAEWGWPESIGISAAGPANRQLLPVRARLLRTQQQPRRRSHAAPAAPPSCADARARLQPRSSAD